MDRKRRESAMRPPPGDVGTAGDPSCSDYPQEVKDQFTGSFLSDPFDPTQPESKVYDPPKPENVKDVIKEGVNRFITDAKAAYDKGVWQTDSSHHARHKSVDAESLKGGTTVVEAAEGKKTLRLAYFFAGVKRKASVAEELRALSRPRVSASRCSRWMS